MMSSMDSNDELGEVDTTEAEFDAMWESAEPVDVHVFVWQPRHP